MKEKIGIYVCECGPNIADKVDIEKIISEVSALKDFKDKELVVKQHKLLCSNDGKKFLEEEIIANELTHLVCAACSPRDHDATFINICKKTQLNPYLYRMVNIREQCAWIIPDKEEATRKAVQYIHGAMDRVLYQTPLYETELDTNPDVLVIGGGIAGIETALNLASSKRKVHLIEKTSTLGGKSVLLKEILPDQGESLQSVNRKISELKNNEQIIVYTDTELKSVVGFLGNFEITLENINNNNQTEIMTGAVILANGFKLLDPADLVEFDYSEKDDVYTALEIEEQLTTTGKVVLRSGEKPKSAALIHCVGRDRVHYCSSICCNYLMKSAYSLKKFSPSIKVFDLYKHLTVPQKMNQKFHDDVIEKGVESIHIREVSLKGSKINYTDISGEEKELEVDMVILAPAIIPNEDNKKLAELLNIDLHETGFFQESHMKINPVSTNTDGVFIVGACRGSCNIPQAMIQAQAAGGKILTQLIPGQKIVPEVMVSEVLEAYCTGCKTCLEVCGYGAIYFDEEKGVSVVNEAICRGCGNCVGSCPSGSIRTRHFTNPQLYQEVKEALR